MAHELAFRGYDVIIAARNSERAKELVLQIQQKLDNSIISSPNSSPEVGRSEGSKLMPKISFIEYHADIHQSALDLASKLEVLESTKPLTVLINNAGIMGESEKSTMAVLVTCLSNFIFDLNTLPDFLSTRTCVFVNVGHFRGIINNIYGRTKKKIWFSS